MLLRKRRLLKTKAWKNVEFLTLKSCCLLLMMRICSEWGHEDCQVGGGKTCALLLHIQDMYTTVRLMRQTKKSKKWPMTKVGIFPRRDCIHSFPSQSLSHTAADCLSFARKRMLSRLTHFCLTFSNNDKKERKKAAFLILTNTNNRFSIYINAIEEAAIAIVGRVVQKMEREFFVTHG